MIHDAFEAYLASQGCSLERIIGECPYSLPIVHAEADFIAPATLGEQLSLTLTVDRMGETSFTLTYAVANGDGEHVATAKTVHVAVDKISGASVPLPDEIRKALESDQ